MQTNYKLVDTGDGCRLEKFGKITINRAAVQAFWKKQLPKEKWDNADLIFSGEEWTGSDAEFTAYFDDVKFSLKPMSMGQVGVFPEQAENWAWLKETVSSIKENVKIINGFGYTGGSTLFSSFPHSEVCHVDASKTAVTRAKLNSELSGKDGNEIRYIVDDVITFLNKEVKRGKKYDGFIFDPPAFGRGGNGKVWKLKRDIGALFNLIDDLSGGVPKFILISAHDTEMDAETLADYIGGLVGVNYRDVEKGDLVMHTDTGQHMKNGYFARWRK